MKQFYIIILASFVFLNAFSAVEAKSYSHKHQKQQQANISTNAGKHIQQRHWYNAPRDNTSHFNKSMTISKLNSLATKTINQGSTSSSKHGQGRKVHEYKFKKPIGTTNSGEKARTLKVVTDGKGNVVTAFPKK